MTTRANERGREDHGRHRKHGGPEKGGAPRHQPPRAVRGARRHGGASGPGRGALRRQRATRATARRPGRGGARLGVHSLREVLRGMSARRHRPGSSGGRHPEHAHARHELRRELVRLVHRGERRRASVRGIVPHRGAQGRLDPRDRRARRGGAQPGPVSGLPPHRLSVLLRRLRVRGHGA